MLGFAQQEGREGVEYLEVLVAGEGSEEDLAKGLIETCAPGVRLRRRSPRRRRLAREREREDNGRGGNRRTQGN